MFVGLWWAVVLGLLIWSVYSVFFPDTLRVLWNKFLLFCISSSSKEDCSTLWDHTGRSVHFNLHNTKHIHCFPFILGWDKNLKFLHSFYIYMHLCDHKITDPQTDQQHLEEYRIQLSTVINTEWGLTAASLERNALANLYCVCIYSKLGPRM